MTIPLHRTLLSVGFNCQFGDVETPYLRLDYAASDARKVAEEMIKPWALVDSSNIILCECSSTVTCQLNSGSTSSSDPEGRGRRELRTALIDIAEASLSRPDRFVETAFFFYFSGHGETLSFEAGPATERLLIPDPRVMSNKGVDSFSLLEFQDILSKGRVATAVYFLDCCSLKPAKETQITLSAKNSKHPRARAIKASGYSYAAFDNGYFATGLCEAFKAVRKIGFNQETTLGEFVEALNDEDIGNVCIQTLQIFSNAIEFNEVLWKFPAPVPVTATLRVDRDDIGRIDFFEQPDHDSLPLLVATRIIDSSTFDLDGIMSVPHHFKMFNKNGDHIQMTDTIINFGNFYESN